MKKKYKPHEPEEEVLTAVDSFQDAEQSEARWLAFEKDEKLRRLLVELPEPACTKFYKWTRGRQKRAAQQKSRREIGFFL